jgi:uncharacterized membrane protein YcaP (DUF421 family)
MLRERGVSNIGHVHYAYLEVTGAMSVFEYAEGERRQGRSIVPPEETRYRARRRRHRREKAQP